MTKELQVFSVRTCIEAKITSNAKMRRYAKIDIFVCFTVLDLKYGVVLPSLITNDFYPPYKFTSKSIFFKLIIRNDVS